MNLLLSLVLLCAPVPRATPAAPPPEQKVSAATRELLGVTADGLAVFELSLTGDGPPELDESLRLVAAFDKSGARKVLLRRGLSEGQQRAADPEHLWDTAGPVAECEKWLAAHKLQDPEEVNLLAGEAAQPAAGGALFLKRDGEKSCDVTLFFERGGQRYPLARDPCGKGETALPLVQARVQVVRTKAGELIALARVTRLRPNAREENTQASRLHFLRVAEGALRSSPAASSSSPRTPRR